MPTAIDPMAAFLTDSKPSGENWIYEIKWDGVRALCFIQEGDLRIYSRRGGRTDQQYPELSVLPNYLNAQTAILDGEIAVLDKDGRSRFELIQPRISVADPNTVAHLSRSTPVHLFLFDLLYLDGFDLRGAPLEGRKETLRSILEETNNIRFSQHFTTTAKEMLEVARQMGVEGIIAKDRRSFYESRRSKSWLKLKILNAQEFVICGYTTGDRSYFSSLALGVYENGKLVYVGNVGTGFNQQSLQQISEKLKPLVVEKSPFTPKPKVLRDVVWVKPELVCEVQFLEWTTDGKIRAAAFQGLRPDKAPTECVREMPVSVKPEPPKKIASPSEPKKRQAQKRAQPRAGGGPLVPETSKDVITEVDGQTLKFTHVDKIYYPKEKYRKRDVLNYYDRVAEWLLPHLKDRPLSLKRYPNGIHEEFFFQKNTPETYPDWIRREPIPSDERGSMIQYIIANDRATLLYLTNLGCVDQNPWMSRIGSLDKPDFVLIDLDPYECSFDKIVEAALLVHKKLLQIGMEGYPKTTGGDGLHVYIPLKPVYTYEQVRNFAEILSHLVVAEAPDLFTTPRSVIKRRKGRVYFDYLQISESKTIAAPYVLRAHDGAPVATPLAWKEVKKGLHPSDFTIKNAIQRFEKLGDLFRPVLDKPQSLEPAMRKIEKLADLEADAKAGEGRRRRSSTR